MRLKSCLSHIGRIKEKEQAYKLKCAIGLCIRCWAHGEGSKIVQRTRAHARGSGVGRGSRDESRTLQFARSYRSRRSLTPSHEFFFTENYFEEH